MTLVIPVGPQHPALKEPGFFRFEAKGEEITKVDFYLGYAHRGIEETFARRNYKHNIYLSERVCGICNVCHSSCYVQAVEKIAGIEPPERAKYIRALIAEFERIHSHLLWFGVAAHQMGFDTLFMLAMRDRELMMDMREMVSGNRVHSATNAIGGVRVDLKPEQIPKLLNGLDKLEKATEYYIKLFQSDRTIIARCSNVGVLTREEALKYCAVGPVARASGVKTDVRKDDPYGAYSKLSFEVITENDGDVLARGMVRLREVMESIKISRQILKEIPRGPLKVPAEMKIPPNEAVQRVEGPRGELLYYVRSNGTENPERVRIRTPSYAAWASFTPMMVGGTVAEIPVVLWSVDPCFSCTDRVTLVDAKTGGATIYTLEELNRWGK